MWISAEISAAVVVYAGNGSNGLLPCRIFVPALSYPPPPKLSTCCAANPKNRLILANRILWYLIDVAQRSHLSIWAHKTLAWDPKFHCGCIPVGDESRAISSPPTCTVPQPNFVMGMLYWKWVCGLWNCSNKALDKTLKRERRVGVKFVHALLLKLFKN